MHAFETIKERTSVRSYSDEPLKKEHFELIGKWCREHNSGPFESRLRFKLLDLGPLDSKKTRKLGTYGMIKGARYYILGAVEEGQNALEDLGFCLEKIILEATSIGLGTCWLGGTFKRASFARQMNLAGNEMLPAITPVGLPSISVTRRDRALRAAIGAARRKPWEELFFKAGEINPLSEEQAGHYRDALEAVRLGPSASNRQPWRISMENEDVFHLYLKENPIYNRLLGKHRLQFVDMGIAMCHFALTAKEKGLAGKWSRACPPIKSPGLQYIASWTR